MVAMTSQRFGDGAVVGKALSRQDKATAGAVGGAGLAAGGAGLARYSTKRIKGAVVADSDARRALEAKRTAWRARDRSAKQGLAQARTQYGGRAADYDHFVGWQRGVGPDVRDVPDPAAPNRKRRIKRGDTAMGQAVHDMRAEQLRVAQGRLDSANMRDVVASSRHRAASNAVAQFKGKAPKVQRTFGRLRRAGRAGAVLGVAGAGASLVAAERGRSRPKATGNVPGYSAPRNEVNDRIAAARAEGDRYRAMGY